MTNTKKEPKLSKIEIQILKEATEPLFNGRIFGKGKRFLAAAKKLEARNFLSINTLERLYLKDVTFVMLTERGWIQAAAIRSRDEIAAMLKQIVK